MGRVFLIASGKGGTGKSMFSVNFGATLARRGSSVVLVDMDLGLRNLDLYFGLENHVVYDVYDVLTGRMPYQAGADTGPNGLTTCI